MKQFMLILGGLLVLLLAVASPVRALARTDTVVRIEPTDVYLTPEETVKIEVWVDDVNSLFAFEIEIVFDSDYLFVKDANLDVDGVQVHQGDFLETQEGKYVVVVNRVDNQLGIIQFDMFQLGNETPSKSGSGILISFEITAKEQPAETTLEISSVLLSDRNGIEILRTIEHGTVTIESGKAPFTNFLPLILY